MSHFYKELIALCIMNCKGGECLNIAFNVCLGSKLLYVGLIGVWTAAQDSVLPGGKVD